MSSIANIVVYDGAATPVAHTLVPESVTREGGEIVAVYREQLASVPKYAQVWASLKLAKLRSGVYKTEVRVVVPVMETVTNQNAAGYTAAPKVAYENTNVWSSFFHERSDISGRRLSRQLLVNIANNVTTSVAAATAGAMPELIDTLVAPT